ncbi:MAG TPA: hypothetical protein VKE71_03245 [Candidatus Angelobacter sp.]|nr:hypothetical protein [Candidatus Angelobacter sp.]
MSAATLAATLSVIAASPGSHAIPDALQQLLHMLEEQRNKNPRSSEDLCHLQTDLEHRWQIASSEGHASSTTLYEILEYGWTEWRKLAA